VPSASDTLLAVRSSFVANETLTWQLSRIELFGPYDRSIWFNDCAIRKLLIPYPAMKASALSKIQSAKRRELVEHQQQAMALGLRL
jgi:hypothetical protein